MRVLICEDDKDIQDLLEIIVLNAEAIAVKCDNLDKVNEVLSSSTIDLIIMDYWFKNKDASGLVKQLKVSKHYSDIPIVLISAIPNLSKVAQNLKADAYITKPFNIDDVKSIINQFNKDKSLPTG